MEVWFADEARIGQKEQDHAPLGQAWDASFCAARPEDGVGLYFRRRLPRQRERRWACTALLQQRGHGSASQGNLDCSRPRPTCHPSPRSGGMACLDEAARTKQHHALSVAAEIARAQPRRKHLPIYARQLALKPHLQILRRHFGPLLFCLEQTYRHALENNVHRHARLGSSVIISETRLSVSASGMIPRCVGLLAARLL